MKTRFRFSHRARGRYYWVAVQRMPGDSRTEHVNCDVDWFWNGGDVKKMVAARVTAVQERRRSGAAGPHNNKEPRAQRERAAIKDQER